MPTAGSIPEAIAGLIEHVTFFSDETGFAVLKVKVKGQRELVTVVGTLAAVNAGEWLHAEGRWVRDREHGLQFRADLLKSTPPTTCEGIEKYFASGMVKGVGPVYARKLVARFGEQVFDIIENCSARLEEVEGIGPERRRRIKAAWAEQKIIRGIMVFLHSNGVSTSRAVRIYKTYGENAVDQVRAHPYLLARDIPGIGFKTADQIAQKVGIPRDSLARASAGLQHVLWEATQNGHCALPADRLVEETAGLLQVDRALADQALGSALASGELVEEMPGEERLVFLPHLRKAEEGIASRLGALAEAPPGYPPMDLDKALEWCQRQTGKELAPSQRQALRTALSHRVVIITGGPGVGKTTLIDAVLRILRAKRVECQLAAPTGRAAKRLAEATGFEAMTIHRLLEVNPQSGGFTRNERRPLEGQLLVLDEASMIDVPLFHQVLRALPSHGHLILVGDVDQLPPVGPGMALAHLIQCGRFPVVRLTEVFRQAAGSRIVAGAHQINQGRLPELPGKGALSDFYFVERNDPEEIGRTVVDLVKRRIPERFHLDSIRDIQVLSPMNRGSLGIRALNLRLQDELNPARPETPVIERYGWRFRAGDKVIQTENNYDKEVFNGDIGRIGGVDPETGEVTIRFDGRAVAYEVSELDQISLAYAISIHKAQGSEFPAVIIPLATQHFVMLERKLIYTGVTRGKRLVVLIGQRKAFELAVRNLRSQSRYSGLLARLIQPASQK